MSDIRPTFHTPGIARAERDGTRAETIFLLSPKTDESI